MVAQVEDRFSKSDHLIAAQLLDCSLFPKFVQSFPLAQLSCAIKLWPTALNNKEKLQTELAALYRHTELHTGKSALTLFQTIHENNLQEALSETCTRDPSKDHHHNSHDLRRGRAELLNIKENQNIRQKHNGTTATERPGYAFHRKPVHPGTN